MTGELGRQLRAWASNLIEPADLQLRTGDVLLFAGKSQASESIKWATGSRWSHVALVLWVPAYEFPCLYEATTDTSIPDLESGIARSGVQLVPLARRLDLYPGGVALRQLLDTALAPEDLAALHALRQRLMRRPYDDSRLELMGSAYDGPGGRNEEDLSALFCSELLAESYQALGLIGSGPDDKPSNEHTPADFSVEDENLQWRRGRLGPEIILKTGGVLDDKSDPGSGAEAERF